MKKWITLNISLPLGVWFLIPDGRYGVISILVHLMLLPVSIICLNSISIFKGRLTILLVAGTSLVGVVCGNLIGYVRWGIYSGKIFNPDGETLWITEKIFFYQITVVFAGLVLAAFIRLVFHKNRKSC
jgi:hypothetical protein